jgi:CHAT domain/SIR2-like domain
MPQINYQDLELLIDPAGEDKKYVARVLGTGGGDARTVFSLADLIVEEPQSPGSVADAQAEEPISRHIKLASVSQPEQVFVVRRLPPDFDQAKSLGSRIFDHVFKDGLRIALERSLDQARMRKLRLRLRLNLTSVPELATLPWEYLHNTGLNHFYAQFIETPIVRYLEIAEPIQELLVEESLRMLVMVSSPSDYRRLDVEREWTNLKEALRPLEEQKLLTVERLDKATVMALHERLSQRLQDQPYHIFHFIGHGVFDQQTGEGSLLFENEQGEGDLVSGEILGNLLRNHDALRLAVLNACEGARLSRTDSYAGIAQKLLLQGRVPAVIAMQYEITDDAAITFARQFYGALAKGFPIDAALSEARFAIVLKRNKVEWATPVLYMRSSDARLRGDSTPSPPAPQPDRGAPAPPPPPAQPAPSAHPLDAHFRSVIESLRRGQLVFFLGLDVNLYSRPVASDWAPGQTLPSSVELAAHLARVFEYPLKNIHDLASVAQYATTRRGGLGLLYDEMFRIFNDTEHAPNGVHQFLATVAANHKSFLKTNDSLLRRFLIVTTSYDNLLERAFKDLVPNYHVVSYVARGQEHGKFIHTKYVDFHLDDEPKFINSPNDYKGLLDENPIILKLPGTVEAIEQRFAITEDHYSDYLTHRELGGLLPSVLTGKLKRSSHLFLGYSLRDWNMRALLYRIWEEQKPTYQSWAVLPVPLEIDEKFWKACEVEIIREELKDYISALAERMPQT